MSGGLPRANDTPHSEAVQTDAKQKRGNDISEQDSGFIKHDNGKNRLELIEPEFIEGIGKIVTFGAAKYQPHNWKKASSPEDRDRIFGALLRHLLAYHKGDHIDDETGESHLYHAACNLMFLDYFDRQDEPFMVG